MNGYRWDAGALLLDLHVQPGARTSGFCGPHGDAMKVRIAAPALDGRANQALIEFLATTFAVPRRCVAIESGLSGRRKRVRIASPVHLPQGIAPP